METTIADNVVEINSPEVDMDIFLAILNPEP